MVCFEECGCFFYFWFYVYLVEFVVEVDFCVVCIVWIGGY